MPSLSTMVICPKFYLERTYKGFGKPALIGEPAVSAPRKCCVINYILRIKYECYSLLTQN